MRVSFSKYDRNGLHLVSEMSHEDYIGAVAMGNPRGSGVSYRDGRSFKEVVKGMHTALNVSDK